LQHEIPEELEVNTVEFSINRVRMKHLNWFGFQQQQQELNTKSLGSINGRDSRLPQMEETPSSSIFHLYHRSSSLFFPHETASYSLLAKQIQVWF